MKANRLLPKHVAQLRKTAPKNADVQLVLDKAFLGQSFVDVLTQEMPEDFKDWHENAESELPEVAAFVIRNLRQRLEDAESQLDKALDEMCELRADIQDLEARLYQ